MDEVTKLSALKATAETLGGQILIKGADDVVKGVIAHIRQNYKELAHFELIALCANLDASMAIYELLTGAASKMEAAQAVMDEEKQSRDSASA